MARLAGTEIVTWAARGWGRRRPLATAVPSTPGAVAISPDLVEHREVEREFMFGSLLCLWAAGATVLLAAVLAIPPPASRRGPLLLLGVAGYVGLAAVAAGRRRLPAWAPEACAYLCHLMVSSVVWAYGSRSAPFALFYLWFGVHAFYFLPWRRAARQLPVVAVAYWLALAAGGGGGERAVQWVLTLATLVAVCGLVAVLRRRFDDLVERLADTAATDRVTGLGNRHTFDQLVEREFERARRANLPLSLVLGDLDGFKAVNDRFGHRVGDEMLRRLAVVLCEQCRIGEPPMRIGGDEFAFVLVATDRPEAEHFAERIRLAVRAEFVGDAQPVTISLGVASYPSGWPGLADLFRAADDAVYSAKRAGRDRAVAAAPEPSPASTART
ncbi:MAG: diguanylate cyclase [Acidimicrobiales bacterium]